MDTHGDRLLRSARRSSSISMSQIAAGCLSDLRLGL